MILTVTRVLCTGSRDLGDEVGRLLVDQVLDDLFREVKAHLHILVGDCPTGTDAFVRNWATWRQRQGWAVEHEEFVAHWSTTFPRSKAGPDRNRRMVDAGADLCLAFYLPVPVGVDPKMVNKGTRGCVKLARAAGIRVVEYGKETPTTTEYEQETLPI